MMPDSKAAFEQFKQDGDFLAFTRQFERDLEQTYHFDVLGGKATLLNTGVLLVEPENPITPARDIVISSGVHGNETAPIEIVNQLVSEIVLKQQEIKHRTLFMIGNIVAMNISKRFEVENMNRLFMGKHANIGECYEKHRAAQLERYVTNFFEAGTEDATRHHYDLRTAIRDSKYEKFAIYPYQGNKPWDKEQLCFMKACGVSTILFGHAPSGTFSYYSSASFGAHAFTVELGKVRPFGENDMANFAAATDTLRNLITNTPQDLGAFNNDDFNLFTVLCDITKETDNFKLNISEDLANFTDFEVGTVLSEDDTGNYVTKEQGEAIVFPNAKVGNGQRAGLMVIPTEL